MDHSVYNLFHGMLHPNELTTTVKKDCRWEVVSSLEHEDEDV